MGGERCFEWVENGVLSGWRMVFEWVEDGV